MTITIDLDEDKTRERQPAILEKKRRQALIAANDAFAARLNRAIRRGREHAAAGTYVDHSVHVVRQIRGEPFVSPVGSPGQMCVEGKQPDSGRMKRGPHERS
jgi:hypothetical protein